MKQETGRTDEPPTGLVEHPLLPAFGENTLVAVGSGHAVFALLLEGRRGERGLRRPRRRSKARGGSFPASRTRRITNDRCPGPIRLEIVGSTNTSGLCASR